MFYRFLAKFFRKFLFLFGFLPKFWQWICFKVAHWFSQNYAKTPTEIRLKVSDGTIPRSPPKFSPSIWPGIFFFFLSKISLSLLRIFPRIFSDFPRGINRWVLHIICGVSPRNSSQISSKSQKGIDPENLAGTISGLRFALEIFKNVLPEIF